MNSDNKQLDFYLKYENPIDAVMVNDVNSSEKFNSKQMAQSSARLNDIGAGPSYPNDGVLSVYYNIKANGTTVQGETMLKNLHIEKNPIVFLYRFNLGTGSYLTENETEFTVFLNIEFMYSVLITHISKNIENFYKSNKVASLRGNDLTVILKNLTETPYHQNCGFNLALRWRKHYYFFKLANNIYIVTTTSEPIDDCIEDIFESFEWKHINLSDMISLRNSTLLSRYTELAERLENEIVKKASLRNIAALYHFL